MNEDKLFCVLYNKETARCRALKEMVCKTKDCPFFKSIYDYKLTPEGYVVEKEKPRW